MICHPDRSSDADPFLFTAYKGFWAILIEGTYSASQWDVMRILGLLLVIQLALVGCAQNSEDRVSHSVVPTDATVTPENPIVIQPRGEKATPHTLGHIQATEGRLEKRGQEAELNFEAQLNLLDSRSQVKSSKKINLRGKIDVDGHAVLYPVNGDTPGELPVRARVTCLSNPDPMACDQAIIDIFVKEGEKTHATQVLADLRENIPPKSFAPTPEDLRVLQNPTPDTQPEKLEEPAEKPVPTEDPKDLADLEDLRGAQETLEDLLEPLSSGGPLQRFANGRGAKAKEQKGQGQGQAQSPTAPPVTEEKADADEEANFRPASGPLQRFANSPAARAKREAQEKEREEALKALQEAQQKSRAAVENPPAPPATPEAQANATSSATAPKPAAPSVNSAPPGKTEPPASTEEKSTEDAAPEADEENEEPEGVDPTDRPSFFIGTLYQSSDDLFKTDRPPVQDQKNVPLPPKRPDIPKDQSAEKQKDQDKVRDREKEAPVQPAKPARNRPRDQVIGEADSGSLQRASNLTLKESDSFNVIRPSRKRHFGSYELVEIIDYIGRVSQQRSIGALQVGDLSLAYGGKIPNSSHRSHQNGLDVDIAYPVRNSEKVFTNMVTSEGYLRRDLKIEETWTLLKAAWATKSVDRIFVDRKIKQALCAVAQQKGDLKRDGSGPMSELLRRVRPTPGHGTHFHLRIRCSLEQPQCRMMGDPPTGSGC